MMRLDKLLAHCGYGTRKEVKELIRKGQVSVNGEYIWLDDYKVNEDEDEIVIEGYLVDYQKNIYYMMNKKAGIISASSDRYQQTVLDIINDPMPNLFPVGRLDIDTEGLLLICNDGKLAHNLLSPKKHVIKKYYVEYSGEMKSTDYAKFAKGIILEDGYLCKEATYEALSKQSGYLSIREGKFHQVKRMFASLNLEVVYLKRVQFGPLALDEKLEPGQYRLLTEAEINLLKETTKFSF